MSTDGPDRGSQDSELSTTEHRLLAEFAVERVAEAVYWMTRDGRIVYVNEAACKATGFSKAELLAMHIYELDPDLTAERWTALWEVFRTAERRPVEVRHRTKAGGLVPLEVVANYFVFNGREYSCAFARDITERKQLEHRLRQSEKMRAIGLLAGGVAHDFNNQLAGIGGCADLLDLVVEGNKEAKSLVADIHLAIKRSADLTRQLLAFSRQGKYVSGPVNVHDLAGEVINLIDHSASQRIRVVRRFDARWSVVDGDASQLQSAILNLAINAREAMPEGGVLTLGTENRELDDVACAKLDNQVTPGRYLVISVSDNGIGMAPETLERIFEPFFTTKEKTGGTGLGLAAIYGTVKNHKGAISVTSAVDQGTTFQVFLPVSSAQPVPQVGPRRDETPPVRKLAAMVIEDDPLVRDIARRMLESLNCRVSTFEEGERAVAYFAGAATEIDLVLLDLCMPGLSSRETFARLQKINPRVKVLLASGYSVEGEAQELLDNGACGFLQKPYRRAALAEALHKLAKPLVGAPRSTSKQ